MSSVRKIDLSSTIAKETGLTIIDTRIIIDALLESLSDALIAENTIELRGFGTFSVVERMPRLARNMATGEKLKVAATKDLTMKPCKSLKEFVNNSLSKKDAE